MGRKNNVGAGFTLIEILIVVAIIALLALAVIWALNSSFFKGRDARRKADIDRLKIAAEEYEKDHNCYPPPELMYCNTPPHYGKGLTPYLDLVPCDPVTKASYFYFYDGSTCPQWFKLYTKLENTKDASVVSGIGPNAAFNYVAGSPNAPDEGATGQATAPPTGGAGGVTGYWGCKSGACVPIGWDPSRPGTECDPSYQNDYCNSQCTSGNECTPWSQPPPAQPF